MSDDGGPSCAGDGGTSYTRAAEYWAGVPATVDGVLGGFGFISNIDIEGSRVFLRYLLSLDSAPPTSLALDCGAGIGRITKFLLVPNFETVDLVEQDPKFVESAREFLQEAGDRVGSFYTAGLQDFQPVKKYDLIWCQWVLGHLNDADLLAFFVRCRNSLSDNGIIVVKENVTSSGKVETDDVDSSVTRPLKGLLSMFKKAKLKRIKECKQTNFPKGIYPVYMFALVPEVKYSSIVSANKKESHTLVNDINKLNLETEKIQNSVHAAISFD